MERRQNSAKCFRAIEVYVIIYRGICNTSCFCMKLLKFNDSASWLLKNKSKKICARGGFATNLFLSAGPIQNCFRRPCFKYIKHRCEPSSKL